MNPERKKELKIFLVALAAIVVSFAGGVLYLRGNSLEGNAGLLADVSGVVSAETSSTSPSQSIPTSSASVIPLVAPAATSTSSGASAQSSSSSTQPAPITPKKLPYVTKTFAAADWLNDWGDVSFTGGTLNYGASSETAGGAEYLLGSTAWTNYNLQANVDWVNGEAFDIVARESNDQNFIYCEFGANFTNIIERVAGTDTEIASSNSTTQGPGSVSVLGVRVYGNDVACTVGGSDVLTAAVKTGELSTGGIGFISWDQTDNVSQIKILGVNVQPLSTDNIVIPPPAPPAPPAPTSTAQTSTPPAPPQAPPISLPYSIGTFGNGFASDTAWTDWQGTVLRPGSVLTIASPASGTTGGALLAGSDAWTDFTFSTNIDWNSGEAFGLIGHYVDDNDYVVCGFDQDIPGNIHMTIHELVNGSDIDLADGDIPNYNEVGGAGINVGMSVQGNQATCGFNGYVISTLVASTKLTGPLHGEIGFDTYDPANGNSEITVHTVGVVSQAYNLGTDNVQDPAQ